MIKKPLDVVRDKIRFKHYISLLRYIEPESGTPVARRIFLSFQFVCLANDIGFK